MARPYVTGSHLIYIGPERGTAGHHTIPGLGSQHDPIRFSPYVPTAVLLTGIRHDRYHYANSARVIDAQTRAQNKLGSLNRFDFGHAYKRPTLPDSGLHTILQISGSFLGIFGGTIAGGEVFQSLPCPIITPCIGWRNNDDAPEVSAGAEANECTTHFPIPIDHATCTPQGNDILQSSTNVNSGTIAYSTQVSFNKTLCIDQSKNDRALFIGWSIIAGGEISNARVTHINLLNAHISVRPYTEDVGEIPIFDPVRG